MAASEIPPQMANFQTFFLKDLHLCVKFQPFSPKAAYFGIDKHPKLQFSAQWNDRNFIITIGPS